MSSFKSIKFHLPQSALLFLLAASIILKQTIANNDEVFVLNRDASENNSTQTASSNQLFSNSNQQDETITNHYINSQTSKFRVNVSNLCEKTHMRVTIRLNKPFYGLIHAKDKRKKQACQIEGTGEQTYTIELSYTQLINEPDYCGMTLHYLPMSTNSNKLPQSHQTIGGGQQQHQQTLSIILVVRLHKSIEFSDDRYFLLSCANRCSRPDCSNQVDPGHHQKFSASNTLAQAFKGLLVASDSIVTPVLKSSLNESQLKIGGQSIPISSQSLNTSAEPCDIMLDLKFQWLLKLCWVLSALLVIVFCITLYLSVELNNIKRSSGKEFDGKLKRHEKSLACSKTNLIRKKSITANSSTLYPQSENISWSTATTAATTTNTNDNFEKIRGENNYLAKQHQQLALKNLLANEGSTIQQVNYLDNQENGNLAPKMVLGRALESTLNQLNQRQSNSGSQTQPIFNNRSQIRRRRSIGSSTGLVPVEIMRNHQHQLYDTSNQFVDQASDSISQRAKSRSQTTIHYDQNQDPFKTVPFSYLNNEYLSDEGASNTHQDVYNLNSCSENFQELNREIGMQQYEDQSRQTQEPNQYQPMMNSMNNELQSNLSGQKPMQRNWSQFKSSFTAPSLATVQQPQSGSQFDPQHSRHLIDLIQHKHQQQIEQAYRTAATIKPPELFPAQIPANQQNSVKQLASYHQHNNQRQNTNSGQIRPWR